MSTAATAPTRPGISSGLLSLYDAMGFAAIEELLTEGILDQALPALERVIARDKNHPCVVIWSTANELDGTRLATFVVGSGDVAPHRAFEDADESARGVSREAVPGRRSRAWGSSQAASSGPGRTTTTGGTSSGTPR